MIKKFFLKLSLILLPIGLLVIGINIYVDPAHIINSKEYIKEITNILSKGNNVNNVSNFDERLLQLELIKKVDSFDVAILGSSRIMEIRTSFFENKKLLNCGVSHANINDLIALAGIMDSLKKMPKEIYIGLDYSTIATEISTIREWQSIEEFYNYFIKKHTNKKTVEVENRINIQKIKTVCSFEYFNKSVSYLLKGNKLKIENVYKQTPKSNGRFFDGSISYNYEYTHPNNFLIANDARRTSKNGITSIDTTKFSLLIDLINNFKKQNVNVTFVLIPYHINFYNGVNENKKVNLIVYENLYRDLSSRNNITLIGSFSAEKCKIAANEFYDMYHCSGESIKRIFNQNNIK